MTHAVAARAASMLARRAGRAAMVSCRSHPMAGAVSANALRSMATVAGGSVLTKLAHDNPHMEMLRYEHKNVKWTLKQIDYYADALACGILENGLQPGDVVLSWLPDNFAELHILQFACSKGGLILYNLDPAQAITDPEGAKASLKKALEVTEANVLVTQEAGNDVNYVRLCEEVIPEIRIFNFTDGMPFITPRFPNLRLPIQTGFDQTDKWGMLVYKHMLVPSGELSNLLAGKKVDGSTPLMGELVMGSDGLPSKGKVLTNDQVVKSSAWPVFASVVNKKYQEIEGVGVVF